MIIRAIAATIAAGLVGLSATAAEAGQTTPGYIYGIQSFTSGVYFFQTDGTRSGSPSCQNGNLPQRWVFDASTAAGASLLATVLTAWAQHKPIAAYGSGSCTISGDNETLVAVTTDGV